MNPDKARADLREVIKSFVDGPMGSANNHWWSKQLKIYDDLLSELDLMSNIIEAYKHYHRTQYEYDAEDALLENLERLMTEAGVIE